MFIRYEGRVRDVHPNKACANIEIKCEQNFDLRDSYFFFFLFGNILFCLLNVCR